MDFLECKVCNMPYDEGNHQTRNAPCGHEICGACIAEFIKCGVYCCPTCRLLVDIRFWVSPRLPAA